MSSYAIRITGRKTNVIIKDHETKKMKLAEDTSPQLMQYRDLRHALTDAPMLAGLSQQNPNAVAEVRPPNLTADQPGEKLPLSHWIEFAKGAPLPPLTQRVEPAVVAQGPAEVDALLAAGAKVVPTNPPHLDPVVAAVNGAGAAPGTPPPVPLVPHEPT